LRLERADRAAIGVAQRAQAAAREKVVALSERLDALSPLSVLERGYAVCRKPGGAIVTRAGEVAVDESLEILLREGRLEVQVRRRRADAGDVI
jgi:exodeoxyribonuclease VII large subunit